MTDHTNTAPESIGDAECAREAFEHFGRDAHRFYVGWRFNDARNPGRSAQHMDLFRAAGAVSGCSAIASLLRANDGARSEGARVLTELHADALHEGLHALLGYVGDYLEARCEQAVDR